MKPKWRGHAAKIHDDPRISGITIMCVDAESYDLLKAENERLTSELAEAKKENVCGFDWHTEFESFVSKCKGVALGKIEYKKLMSYGITHCPYCGGKIKVKDEG